MGHSCHAHACNVMVPPAMFMCRRHWFMVPKPLRDAIWATYRRGQETDKNPSDPYLKNASEAVKMVAAKEGITLEHTSYDGWLEARSGSTPPCDSLRIQEGQKDG